MTEESRPETLLFWETLDTTDPSFTQTSEYGAKLTSINGVYQFKKMTELFGPCGIGWGYEVTMERFDDTGPLYARKSDGNRGAELVYSEDTGLPLVIGNGSLHTLMIKLWYRMPASPPIVEPTPVAGIEKFGITGDWKVVNDRTGETIKVDNRFEIEGIGHTPFRHYSGPKALVVTVDEEYYKKSLTDALTNAMAKLGMSADVRMGMFDDSEYRAQLDDEMAVLHAQDKDAEMARQRHEFEDWLKSHMDVISTEKNIRTLEIIYKGGRPRVERQGTPDQIQAHFEAKNAAVRRINKADDEPDPNPQGDAAE